MATKDEDKRYNALGQEVEYDEDSDRYVPVKAEEGQSAEALFYAEHEKDYEEADKDK